MMDKTAVRRNAEDRPALTTALRILRLVPHQDPGYPLLLVAGSPDHPELALLTPDREAVFQEDVGAYGASLLRELALHPQDSQEILDLLDEFCPGRS